MFYRQKCSSDRDRYRREEKLMLTSLFVLFFDMIFLNVSENLFPEWINDMTNNGTNQPLIF